jgi:ketosteroid isomerase-like protein
MDFGKTSWANWTRARPNDPAALAGMDRSVVGGRRACRRASADYRYRSGDEIAAFRKTLVDAIKARDAAKLRELYAPSFVHTHTSGKLDARDARIVAALAGDPVIETAEVSELEIRVPNDWTAIATGLSSITSLADGKTYAVRWMAVYVRTEKSWALAASQATRSHEIKN